VTAGQRLETITSVDLVGVTQVAGELDDPASSQLVDIDPVRASRGRNVT